MLVWNTWKCLLAGALFASVATLPLAAQSNSSSLNASSPTVPPIEGGTGYNQPPENILKVMHATFPPYPAVSPTGDSILLVYVQNYPSIARVATPFLRLAGVRVEPRNHSKHDTPGGYGITECGTGFDLVHIPDGTQAHIALPVGACPGEPTWSADGRRFAFVNLAAEAVELWIGDGKTGEVSRGRGAAQPDVQRRDAMDGGPEDAAGEAGARGVGRAAPGAHCADGSEHPGDGRRKRAEQHL